MLRQLAPGRLELADHVTPLQMDLSSPFANW
jgi:hypothetical protein